MPRAGTSIACSSPPPRVPTGLKQNKPVSWPARRQRVRAPGSQEPALEVAESNLEDEALPEEVRIIMCAAQMLAEEGLQVRHLHVSIDARRGRQHLVHVVLA